MTDSSATTPNVQSLHMYSWKVVAAIFVLGLAIGFLASLVNVQSAVKVLPQTCEYKGMVYDDGEGFADDCNSCSCSDGQVACTSIACSDTSDSTGSGVGVVVPTYESEFKNIPDITPDSAPTSEVPVSYVIEHRSYLNNSTVMVTGTIVRNSTIEEEECVGERCPMTDAYMQPSLWLSDTLDANRNPYYDLRVLLVEGLTLPDSYTLGAKVTIPVTIVGSSDSIIATYSLIADDGVRR